MTEEKTNRKGPTFSIRLSAESRRQLEALQDRWQDNRNAAIERCINLVFLGVVKDKEKPQ